MLSSTLSHYASIIWLLPTLIACQYYSKRITSHIFLGWICRNDSVSFYVSIYLYFQRHESLLPRLLCQEILLLPSIGKALVYLISELLIYCAAYPLFMNITKRTELLMKKQNYPCWLIRQNRHLTIWKSFLIHILQTVALKCAILPKMALM